jgi:hypothetical protein
LRMMSATSKIKVSASRSFFDLHAILHFTRKNRMHVLHSVITSVFNRNLKYSTFRYFASIGKVLGGTL